MNTRGAIFVHPEGILKRTTYHVFDMYVNHLEDHVQAIELKTEQLSGNNNATTGVLDGILTVSADGKRHALIVVNKDPAKSRKLAIGVDKKLPRKIQGKVLSGTSPDDFNDIGAENRVVPQDKTFTVKDNTVELPPHSLTVLKF